MQNNGSTISSSHFKSSSEFLLLHFQRTHQSSQSSSYYYTFTSHAYNLDFWFIYNLLLSFDYFQVTIQHDTIEVHEYCRDSLKGSPRLLLFSVIVHESSQKLSVPCRIWTTLLIHMFNSTFVELNMHINHFNHCLYCCWRTKKRKKKKTLVTMTKTCIYTLFSD